MICSTLSDSHGFYLPMLYLVIRIARWYDMVVYIWRNGFEESRNSNTTFMNLYFRRAFDTLYITYALMIGFI